MTGRAPREFVAIASKIPVKACKLTFFRQISAMNFA